MQKRPGTSDHAIIMNVMVNNEYKLPDDMKDWVVIDIGAHIGAFSMACIERGAKAVYAVEPISENFELLCQNTSGKQVYRSQAAIWGGGVPYLRFSEFPRLTPEELNTGGVRLHPDPKMGTVAIYQVAQLHDIISTAIQESGKVDLVKMDCEYSEWDIFYGGSTALMETIPRIIGEFHEDKNHPRWLSCDEQGLISFFQGRDFTVRTERHGDSNLGMFWAEKI